MANGFGNGEYPNMPWPSGYPGLAPGAMVGSFKFYLFN